MPDLDRLNARYEYQTGWSKELRAYLIRQLPEDPKILEVGCGTGAVLRAMQAELPFAQYAAVGLDPDRPSLLYAQRCGVQSLCCGTGEALPFPSGHFDLVCCHYLLLWVKDAEEVLREMNRVTAPGGICAAFAEPCYAEVEACPAELAALAHRQRDSLVRRGIDPQIGSRLAPLFQAAGFSAPSVNRYRSLPPDPVALMTEIRQMQEDCDDSSFIPETDVEYNYSVPTYFAFARK